jgi:beta-phosphoglucomutase-like phosphatase (HAD superfamily)
VLVLPDGIRGCLFDLDGVLTKTAQVHDAAWQEMFDGLAAERDHLRGKPAPDTFLAGARALGLEPRAAAVFEDAQAGVAAGRAGGFGFVVGVDRLGQAAELRERGANVAVADLAALLDSP